MTRLITNARVLDVSTGKLSENQNLLIADGRIERIYSVDDGLEPSSDGLEPLDAQNNIVMPGLCDAHVHVLAWTADIRRLTRTSPFYTAARAAEILEAMLMRGFTTVRDVGGAEYGLVQAAEEGRIISPRILHGGRVLSQTGGHGDARLAGETFEDLFESGAIFSRLCDGVPEVRRACRDEIRRGAKHIKLMLSGGVASPTDRIENVQFSADELAAAVEEAENAGLYVVAHSYTTKTVNRAVQAGVRSLEHCNLIDETSIELLLEHDAFMVPTLVTYEMLASEGVAAGLPETVLPKLRTVRRGGLKALELAHEAGVKLAYGTDLLGDMHRHQLKEFSIREAVQPRLAILQAATINAAELFNETGQTGIIQAGARADLLIAEANPLEDFESLQRPESNLKLIMKGGQIFKNRLSLR